MRNSRGQVAIRLTSSSVAKTKVKPMSTTYIMQQCAHECCYCCIIHLRGRDHDSTIKHAATSNIEPSMPWESAMDTPKLRQMKKATSHAHCGVR